MCLIYDHEASKRVLDLFRKKGGRLIGFKIVQKRIFGGHASENLCSVFLRNYIWEIGDNKANGIGVDFPAYGRFRNRFGILTMKQWNRVPEKIKRGNLDIRESIHVYSPGMLDMKIGFTTIKIPKDLTVLPVTCYQHDFIGSNFGEQEWTFRKVYVTPKQYQMGMDQVFVNIPLEERQKELQNSMW